MSGNPAMVRPPRLLQYPRRLKLVAMVTVLLFAAALIVAALVAWRQDSLVQSPREDTAWVAYKLDHDAVQLLNHLLISIRSPLSPAEQDALNLRFELLYSRITLLKEGDVNALLQRIDNAKELLSEIQQQLDLLDSMLAPHEVVAELPVTELVNELQVLSRLTERFVIAVNRYLAESDTEERAVLSKLYKLLISLLVGMCLAVVLVIGFLVREMRESATARREQEQLSQQLSITAQQAQAANQAKSDFLAMVSHEIRTPLNGVVGMSELLCEPTNPVQVEDYASTIHDSANQLLAMINEILDFSKIEAGHLTLTTSSTALKPMVESVASLFEPRAQAKGLRLKVIIDALVPAWVMLDASRFRQILINLVANAIKFTDRGEVTIQLSSTVEHLLLEVSDTGCGISAHQQTTLFEPFQQANASIARRYGGTGLGLAICKRLSEAMQGRIGLSSTPGQGSTFYCELPLVAASPMSTPLTAEPSRDFSGTSLLVVEDNAINRKVAVGLLSRLGGDVVCAESGQDALSMVQIHSFQLIFMDIQLPDMDGIVVTQQLRQKGGWLADVPIVAMTAGGRQDDRARCLTAGMDDYIIKPLSLLSLSHVLSRQLSGSSVTSPLSALKHAVSEDARLLNSATLSTLLSALEADSVAQLIRLYDQQMCDYAAQLATYLTNTHVLSSAQAQQVARLAHQLRGESLSVGAEQLAAQALYLERLVADPTSTPDQIDAAFSRLRHCIALTQAALEKWRRNGCSDQ